MLSEWVRGTGGAYIFSFPEYPSGTVMVVTRMAPSEKQVDPVIPSVDPGGDLVFTKTGFSPETGMPTLIIQATSGLECAVADATGRILTKEDREKWMITAETLDGLDVMPDETNFYSTGAMKCGFWCRRAAATIS